MVKSLIHHISLSLDGVIRREWKGLGQSPQEKKRKKWKKIDLLVFRCLWKKGNKGNLAISCMIEEERRMERI